MTKLILCCAIFLVSIGLATAAQGGTGMTTITVSGQGMVSRAPDFATIAASILTNDADSTKATSDNNARFEALKAALNVPGDDIRTSYYNVSYVPPDGNPRPVGYISRYGYTVSRQLQIKIANVASSGAAADAIVHVGATNVVNITYGLIDQRSAYAEAIKDAMLDARSQADAIASAAHVRILRLRSVQSGYYGGGPVRLMGMPPPTPAPMGSSASTNLQPGAVEVHASVTAVYDVGL